MMFVSFVYIGTSSHIGTYTIVHVMQHYIFSI
jgi:hypothetical protein